MVKIKLQVKFSGFNRTQFFTLRRVSKTLFTLSSRWWWPCCPPCCLLAIKTTVGHWIPGLLDLPADAHKLPLVALHTVVFALRRRRAGAVLRGRAVATRGGRHAVRDVRGPREAAPPGRYATSMMLNAENAIKTNAKTELRKHHGAKRNGLHLLGLSSGMLGAAQAAVRIRVSELPEPGI